MYLFDVRLKELRTKRNLSLKKLGEIIGASDTAIMKWEHNTAEPKASYIIALANFFDVSSDYLLGLEDETEAKANIQNSFNNFQNSGNINL